MKRRSLSVVNAGLALLAASQRPLTFASEEPIDLGRHTPRFEWREGASGEHWIYDGELPVGDFYAGTEPMGSIAKPISLHNLRLVPGGPVFIRKGEGCGPLCLSWRKHLIFKMTIDALEPDDSDPERFRLYLKAHDVALRGDQPKEPPYRPNNVVEETWLEVSYDRELPSYVFDVRTRLTLEPEGRETMLLRDFRGLEFGDLLPAGANDRFRPRGSKRFPWLIYRAPDGRLYKLPQTHHLNQGHFPGFRLTGCYRVRARVRTENVTGGVRLAWQVISPRTDVEYSPALEGTHDWTLLELETPDVGRARQADVRLIQEGAGQSWFDDLEIVPIPWAAGAGIGRRVTLVFEGSIPPHPARCARHPLPRGERVITVRPVLTGRCRR